MSTREYDRQFLDEANRKFKHELIYHAESLHRATATVAAGCPAVCAFVDDQLDGPTLAVLAAGGTRLIALRSAVCRQSHGVGTGQKATRHS
jgi:D-lactate dehydrogenase